MTDSRKQITLLLLSQNRFTVVASNLNETPCVSTFTGRPVSDQILTVLSTQKKLRVISLTGD